MFGKRSTGITEIGEKGGPLHHFDSSQHKLEILSFTSLNAHDIYTSSSTPTKVLSFFTTCGCKPALGGSTIATILKPFPLL